MPPRSIKKAITTKPTAAPEHGEKNKFRIPPASPKDRKMGRPIPPADDPGKPNHRIERKEVREASTKQVVHSSSKERARGK